MDAERHRFEELVAECGPMVWSYLLRRARRADAEDAFAETFVVAWRRRELVPDNQRAWLIGIARHVLMTQLRGDARRRALVTRLKEGRSAASWDPEPGYELSEQVSQALTRLSVSDREALLLVAWEELTPEEAADVLEISPTAFRVRLHRARRRFEQEFEDRDERQSLSRSAKGAHS